MTYAWYTANSSQQATELKEKRKHSRIFVCGSSSREFCFSQRRRRRRRRAIWQTNNDNWMTFELCLRSVCVLQGRGFCGHLCVWATCRNYGNESFACRLITSTKTDSFKPTTFSRTSGKSKTSRRARDRKQGDTKLWQDICREVRLTDILTQIFTDCNCIYVGAMENHRHSTPWARHSVFSAGCHDCQLVSMWAPKWYHHQVIVVTNGSAALQRLACRVRRGIPHPQTPCALRTSGKSANWKSLKRGGGARIMLSPAVGKNINQVGGKISRKLIKITHNTTEYNLFCKYKGENLRKSWIF